MSSRVRQLADRGIFQLGKIPPLTHYRGIGRNDEVYPEAELRGILSINIITLLSKR